MTCLSHFEIIPKRKRKSKIYLISFLFFCTKVGLKSSDRSSAKYLLGCYILWQEFVLIFQSLSAFKQCD